jgi:hypothetical protein
MNLFAGEILRGVETQDEVEEAHIQLPVVQTVIQAPAYALHTAAAEVQRFPESQVRLEARNGTPNAIPEQLVIDKGI